MDPNSISDLRNVRSQGANVGDYRDFGGTKWRWNGESWEKQGGSSGGGSAESYMDAAINKMKEANKPVIDSYNAQIPEVQSRYATQRNDLKTRYDNLITSIKGNQQVAENRQTVATSNELGRRGITSSSGIGQQEMTNALNPITQQYTGMLQSAANDQTSAQNESVANETDAVRAIQNAIAQLQSGAASSGISIGTDLYKTDQALAAQARQEAAQQAAQSAALQFQKDQAAKDEAYKQMVYNDSKQKSSGSGGDISSLFQQLGINLSGSQPQSNSQGQYISSIGKSVMGFDSQGRAIYSDGTRGYTYGANSNYWK